MLLYSVRQQKNGVKTIQVKKEISVIMRTCTIFWFFQILKATMLF